MASELRDAITGLTVNAIDALLRKGKSWQNWSCPRWSENEQVVVAVKDTGAGMT